MTTPKLAVARSGFGGRGYRIPGRGSLEVDSKGKERFVAEIYPSVTTCLQTVNKPALYQWIADQTAAKAIASIPYLMAVSEEVAWGSLRWYWSKEPELIGDAVRLYYEGVKNDAAELGTAIHAYAEADIDELTPHPEITSIEMDEMVEAWEWFRADHEIVSHRQEFTIVNDTLRYAGTGDADWTITCLHEPDEAGNYCLGKEAGPHRTLVDLKSSRHTWNEHGFQLAALGAAEVIMREVSEGTPGAQRAEKTEKGNKVVSWWVEDAPPAWERYALLHIRPDDLDSKGEGIPRFCRLVDQTDDMDVFMSGFEAATVLARVNRTLKERAKARGIETEG